MIVIQRKDIRWMVIWVLGAMIIWTWNIIFLNKLSYKLIQSAIINTSIEVIFAVMFSLAFGWLQSMALYFFDSSQRRNIFLSIIFMQNIIRSIPQIIGLLIGYVILTLLIMNGVVSSHLGQILWMSFIIGIFCSLEVSDLIIERINYFKKSDYFNAMLCCGVKERRIINREILLKSSAAHLFHKTISLFGVVIFLQCSIDFIISIGLSLDVSLSNFPVTLGGLLAKFDSKQDILAFGAMFMDITYLPRIFFEHLQGVSIALIIVYTLLCLHQIADGIAQEYDL